jgi:hypothetical protein
MVTLRRMKYNLAVCSLARLASRPGTDRPEPLAVRPLSPTGLLVAAAGATVPDLRLPFLDSFHLSSMHVSIFLLCFSDLSR